jgi:hypothetical protein
VGLGLGFLVGFAATVSKCFAGFPFGGGAIYSGQVQQFPNTTAQVVAGGEGCSVVLGFRSGLVVEVWSYGHMRSP